jgi:acyl-CoA synthetase (AMP-forming)/AMP-acid ligase II
VSLGAIAVPLNLGLPAEDLAAQIDKVKAKRRVVSPELWAGKLEAVLRVAEVGVPDPLLEQAQLRLDGQVFTPSWTRLRRDARARTCYPRPARRSARRRPRTHPCPTQPR